MSESVASVAPGAGLRARRFSNSFLARYGIYVALVLLCVVGAVISGRFLTTTNFLSIALSVGFIGFVAIGMAFVVIGGGLIDLSIDGVMAAAWPDRPGGSAGGRRRAGDPDRDLGRLLRRAGERGGHRLPQSEPRPGHLRGADRHRSVSPRRSSARGFIYAHGAAVQLARQRRRSVGCRWCCRSWRSQCWSRTSHCTAPLSAAECSRLAAGTRPAGSPVSACGAS